MPKVHFYEVYNYMLMLKSGMQMMKQSCLRLICIWKDASIYLVLQMVEQGGYRTEIGGNVYIHIQSQNRLN